MDVVAEIDLIEKIAKIAAILVAGAWVYLKAIRGRIFIPRLQPQVSGNLIWDNGHQYLFVKAKVENVGSSIAKIKKTGSAIEVEALRAFGEVDSIIDLYVEEEPVVFPAFKGSKGPLIDIEPATTWYFEELIEVPKCKYDAFRLELHVSVSYRRFFIFSEKNRKWRAIAMVRGDSTNNAEDRAKGATQ